MPCPEYELRIAEWVEQRLPASETAEVEAHLAACAECREFAARWRELDTTLAQAIRPPTLSADFNARLWQQINSPALGDLANARADLKRQAEAEHAQRLARLQRHYKSLGSLLDALGLGVLCAGAASAAFLLAPELARQALPAGTKGIFAQPMLLAGVVGSALVVTAVLAFCRRGGRALRCV